MEFISLRLKLCCPALQLLQLLDQLGHVGALLLQLGLGCSELLSELLLLLILGARQGLKFTLKLANAHVLLTQRLDLLLVTLLVFSLPLAHRLQLSCHAFHTGLEIAELTGLLGELTHPFVFLKELGSELG